ncbi:EscU/YscU/HrcU family type III secretion system export apparatus switch protein [Leptospira ilyithenensis]|uniref:EscU/YscU/HrcU family type III secretion system export apparatus switch protein n=1 Tax=Leptospira ilyithenensis TaxID=2484901 RepID=A0A4R9LNW0_9LEPT|nr:EscU/YscU/HrcU family type III secretion system export apparatus switch protein [Leptospira ilyithenensis]TGN07172.1 EscU/YscU/HrcU family type III secretion system export apparatus switch protein [Leptospira ilyithenensis]
MIPEEILKHPYYLIDLQLFAAADEGRTEPPSERRRREEKDKGNVPKSNEVSSTLVLLGGTATIFFLGDKFVQNTAVFIKKYLSMGVRVDRFGAEEFRVIMASVTRDFFSVLWPIFAITVVFAIAGNVVQVGFMFTPRALSFRFDRITPNFKKVLPNRQTIFNLLKSLAKVILIGVVSFILISGDFLKVLLTGNMGVMESISLISYSGFKIMMTVGVILLAIAVADFFFQKSEFEDSLKQTPSEAKREMRDDSGDPILKNRRMQLARDMMQGNMLKEVPKADVVITNPTHYSVALLYELGRDQAPRVIAKGENQLALQIRRIAKENDVPIIESPAQARLLYAQVEVGQEIPNEFFQAVSSILMTLEKFKRKVGMV